MANTDSTTHDTTRALINAVDLLSEAQSLAGFVQSIAINAPCKQSIQLSAQQLSGFGYAMQDMIDRVKEAAEIIGGLLSVQRTDNTQVGGAIAGLDVLRNIKRFAEQLNCPGGGAVLTMEAYWQIQDEGVDAMVCAAGRPDPFMTGFLSTIAEYLMAAAESGFLDLEKWKPESVMTEKEKMARRIKFGEEVEGMSAETV